MILSVLLVSTFIVNALAGIFPYATRCLIRDTSVYVSDSDMSRVIDRSRSAPIYAITLSKSHQCFAFKANFFRYRYSLEDTKNIEHIILTDDIFGFVPLKVSFRGMITEQVVFNPLEPPFTMDDFNIQLSMSTFVSIRKQISPLSDRGIDDIINDSDHKILVKSVPNLYRSKGDNTTSNFKTESSPFNCRAYLQFRIYPDHFYNSVKGIKRGEKNINIGFDDTLVPSPELISELRNFAESRNIYGFADNSIDLNVLLAYLRCGDQKRLQATITQRRLAETRAESSSFLAESASSLSCLWDSFFSGLNNLLDSINN